VRKFAAREFTFQRNDASAIAVAPLDGRFPAVAVVNDQPETLAPIEYALKPVVHIGASDSFTSTVNRPITGCRQRSCSRAASLACFCQRT
jgi:hypothetical protein